MSEFERWENERKAKAAREGKAAAIRSRYTALDRFTYWLTRHLVLILIIAAGAILLTASPSAAGPDGAPISMVEVAVKMAATTLLAAGYRCLVVLLILKFVFPRIAFQTEIVEEHNLAAGLVFLGLVWLVS